MKYLVVLAGLFIILMSSSASAQELQAVPPGDDVILSIKKGAVSPIDGQVFSPETALRWGNWLQQLKQRLTADVQKEKDVCKVEKEYRDSLLVIEQKRSTNVEKDFSDRLTRSEAARLKAEELMRNRPFWETPEFGVIIGAVSMAGVFALSVWAVNEVGQQ